MIKLSDTIGKTPLIDIPLQGSGLRTRVFAKLEWFNPSGSIKDRTALYMIEKGLSSGQLSQDMTVLEATSGNTGISLAVLCAAYGLNLKLVMPDDVPDPFRRILHTFGADIVFTPAQKGLDEALRTAYGIVDKDPDTYFLANQFNNGANPQAHYETTGPEILDQVPGNITHLVAGMGTTGTIMGVGRCLRRKFPDLEVIGVEPVKHHHLTGLRHFYDTILPGVYDPSKIHRIIPATDDQAAAALATLYRDHGILAGPSSGAALHGAIEVAKEAPRESTIVTIFPDRGERYLDTRLFSKLSK